MLTEFPLALLAGLLMPVDAPAQPASEPPQVYIELIVKACPSDHPNAQPGRPDAVRGYYTEPINQGKSYDKERSPTKDEREAAFTAMHCIDVPVPPEVIMGDGLTRQACMGHIGYSGCSTSRGIRPTSQATPTSASGPASSTPLRSKAWQGCSNAIANMIGGSGNLPALCPGRDRARFEMNRACLHLRVSVRRSSSSFHHSATWPFRDLRHAPSFLVSSSGNKAYRVAAASPTRFTSIG